MSSGSDDYLDDEEQAKLNQRVKLSKLAACSVESIMEKKKIHYQQIKYYILD